MCYLVDIHVDVNVDVDVDLGVDVKEVQRMEGRLSSRDLGYDQPVDGDDAHNEDPDKFAPVEWEAATAWMRRALHLAGPTETAQSQPPPTRRARSPRRAS